MAMARCRGQASILIRGGHCTLFVALHSQARRTLGAKFIGLAGTSSPSFAMQSTEPGPAEIIPRYQKQPLASIGRRRIR
jgi:hypothetical protein